MQTDLGVGMTLLRGGWWVTFWRGEARWER